MDHTRCNRRDHSHYYNKTISESSWPSLEIPGLSVGYGNMDTRTALPLYKDSRKRELELMDLEITIIGIIAGMLCFAVFMQLSNEYMIYKANEDNVT